MGMLETAAHDGTTEFLTDLGVTREQVFDWVNDGKPTEFSHRHASIIGAINQLSDESVLRSTAQSRPYVGNNRKLAVLWHLKGFTWEYAHRVLGRVYQQSKRIYGREEGIRKFYAALPFLSLALFTLPLAGLGLELRWLFTQPKRRPEFGGADWWWRVVDTAGITGVAQVGGQMLTNMQHRGQFWSPLLGPTVDQSTQAFAAALRIYNGGDASRFFEQSIPAKDFIGSVGNTMEYLRDSL